MTKLAAFLICPFSQTVSAIDFDYDDYKSIYAPISGKLLDQQDSEGGNP